MTQVPRSALLLGLAGLIPFVWGALVTLRYLDMSMGYPLIVPTDGPLLMVRYGGIILAFMSGVLWGFATQVDGPRAGAAYALSVIPALWWFFMPGSNAHGALINLMVGFSGLLILDFTYQRWGLAPPWWLALRIPLTAVVLICLGIGIWS